MIDLEFRHLQIFCEVVRLRSFSRAAKSVGLAQASVSERIAALEEQVGSRLLDRSGRRGVTPTRIGQAFYDRAVRLLADRQLAIQEVHELLEVRAGTLLIGASTVPGTYHLPRILRRMASDYPAARFDVSIAGSEQVVEWVARGKVEIGIAGDPGERLVREVFRNHRCALRVEDKLWRDRFVLAVPRDHPLGRLPSVALRDLGDVPFIMREPGSGTQRWLELYLHSVFPEGVGALRVAAQIGSLCAVKQAVINGLGVSMVSACAVEGERLAGLLHTVEIDGASATRCFYLVRDEHRTLSPLCRRFIDVLLEATRDTLEAAAPA